MKIIHVLLLVAVVAITMSPSIMAESVAEADKPGQAKKIGLFDQIDKAAAAFMKLFEG
uniref:U13-myrmicitoxin-Mri1a n=1 Tax=Manica rubida TaxID=219785 RepID=TX13A_MANRB|nr:RecName: Full=U13-myrmicitoxin-Mri1a; Short=U13-MYRTX-Mri1a; Flags: Precursor [Manica rubida]QIQ51451.1 U13-MYRTX-Mri1a precursor [Manica rubida]